MDSKKKKVQTKKKTRSRSPEKKAAQFEKILEAGKQLFSEKGRDGFSLRGLAKILDMNQNNLYNYVESKRELWIAIRNKFYSQFRDENVEIIKKHHGSTVELLMKIINHFFNFAAKDFDAFKMMHIISSPPSNKVGKLEKDYREFRFLDGTTKVIQRAIDEGEIGETNASILSFFIYSLILGATIVENQMSNLEKENGYEGTAVEESVQFGTVNFTSNKFRKYILKKIELGLKEPNMILKESDYEIKER